MDEIQVGTEGAQFDYTFVDETGAAINLAAATQRLLFFQKPSGVVVQQTGSFISGGTVRYTTAAGFLSEAGEWSWQGKATVGGQVKWGSVNHFRVKANLST